MGRPLEEMSMEELLEMTEIIGERLELGGSDKPTISTQERRGLEALRERVVAQRNLLAAAQLQANQKPKQTFL